MDEDIKDLLNDLIVAIHDLAGAVRENTAAKAGKGDDDRTMDDDE